MNHNGERRHGYRVGGGYGRGGYNITVITTRDRVVEVEEGIGKILTGGGWWWRWLEVVEGTETGYEDGMVRGEVSSS